LESQEIKELKEWEIVYFNKPLIDLSKYLTTKDKEVIKKLKLSIEEKVYTEYEFECLEMDLISFYKQKKVIESLGTTYNEVKRLWDICDKIRIDYCI
jgi:hypothetical protein